MKFNKGFFDSNSENKFKLWTHMSTEVALNQELLLNSSFFKRSKKETELTQREFFLTKKFLYYKKSPQDTKIRGAMMLKHVRMEYSVPKGYQYPKI